MAKCIRCGQDCKDDEIKEGICFHCYKIEYEDHAKLDMKLDDVSRMHHSARKQRINMSLTSKLARFGWQSDKSREILAQRICIITRKILTIGNCNPYSGIPGSRIRTTSLEYARKMVQMSREFMTHLKLKNLSKPGLAEACAASYTQCGNCGEHSALAYLLCIILLPRGLQVERHEHPNDHCFVIVRRPYGRWTGSEPILIDAWANLVVVKTKNINRIIENIVGSGRISRPIATWPIEVEIVRRYEQFETFVMIEADRVARLIEQGSRPDWITIELNKYHRHLLQLTFMIEILIKTMSDSLPEYPP